MKAYLFIETGEERCPERGEYFINVFGSCSRCEEVPIGTRCILTRHEIEIPENAVRLDVLADCKPQVGKIGWSKRMITVPVFSRPKKKVKKCQYVTINSDNLGRKRAEVTGWLTEKEALARGLEPEDRVYQTEIEVEE